MWCKFFDNEIFCFILPVGGCTHLFWSQHRHVHFFHSSGVVFCYYLLLYDVDWNANIFIPFHMGDKIKILMSQHMKCASRVEMLLLNNNFSVVISDVLCWTHLDIWSGCRQPWGRCDTGNIFGVDNPQQYAHTSHLSFCFQLYCCGTEKIVYVPSTLLPNNVIAFLYHWWRIWSKLVCDLGF